MEHISGGRSFSKNRRGDVASAAVLQREAAGFDLGNDASEADAKRR